MAIVIKETILDQPGDAAKDDACWWTKPEAEIGRAMVAVGQRYEQAQFPRREQTRRYVQLHKGQILPTSIYDSGNAREHIEDVHPAWNVVQAVVNTEQSKVTRNRVRTAVQTNGADYTLQDIAKEAELFSVGVYARNKVYEELDPLWFLDADVSGLGALLVEDVDGQVVIDRIIPDELVFSDVEAIYGKPRQLFRCRWMSKWEAISRYGDTPEKVKAIESCNQTFNVLMPGSSDRIIPLVPVWTGWFLPSKRGMRLPGEEDKSTPPGPGWPGKDDICDGRRVIAVPGGLPGCTLGFRHWKHPRFPIAFLRVERAPVGLWGIGAAERLAGFQYRLNELNQDILEAARGGSRGKWLVSTASNVNADQLTDEHNAIVDHAPGQAPEWKLNDGIPKDLLNERRETYEQALKERGLSEWSVGGEQPANVESGEGLRQLSDQESGKQVPAGQAWEAAHVDLSECIFMVAADAAEGNENLSAVGWDAEGDGLKKVEWKTIAKLLADPDQHLVTCYPTSDLPNSPAGRADALWDRYSQGRIDAAQYAALSEQPDLPQEASLQLAGVKTARWMVSQIVKKGPAGYEPPDKAIPLEYAFKLAQQTYLNGLRQGMPEKTVAALMNFADDCRQLAEGKPAPSAPVAPNPQQAVAEPTPVGAAQPIPVDPAAAGALPAETVPGAGPPPPGDLAAAPAPAPIV